MSDYELRQVNNVSLRDDLLASLVIAPMSAALGGIESLVDPFTVPRVIGNIKRGHVMNFAMFASTVAELTAYGVCNILYLKNSIEHPDKITSYIPLATNILFGALQLAHKRSERSKQLRSQDDQLDSAVDLQIDADREDSQGGE
jgi:hypothetical protein